MAWQTRRPLLLLLCSTFVLAEHISTLLPSKLGYEPYSMPGRLLDAMEGSSSDACSARQNEVTALGISLVVQFSHSMVVNLFLGCGAEVIACMVSRASLVAIRSSMSLSRLGFC